MAKRSASRSPKSTSSAKQTTPDALHRILVLHGRERFLLRLRTAQYVEALQTKYGEIERFDFDGNTADLATILDELRSYGLLQQHKLVVLDNAEAFFAKDEQRRRKLEVYAEQPLEQASLLMRAETWRPGKIDKLIAKVGAVIKCEGPTHADAIKWCIGRCGKRYDALMQPAAASLLVERIGADLGRLDMEIMKLAAFVGLGGTITRDVVVELVGMSREDVAWSIQNALATGDPNTALRKLHELINISRVDLVPVQWATTELCRKVHAASAMLAEGVPAGSVASQLKLWPRDIGDRILAIARALTPAQAAQLLHEAVDSDRRNKSGVGEPSRNLEALTLLVADTMGHARR